MFKTINHISDIQKAVSDKKEIRFFTKPNGITIVCYLIMDSNTFDSPEALECRGIAFDQSGKVISRPLHKFFNVGEKEWLSSDSLMKRSDISAIFDKIDGSMIATAWVNGELRLRSKKEFDSKVVELSYYLLSRPEYSRFSKFLFDIASSGMTAICELVHPETRIVVSYPVAELKLLHVRDNISGQYVMLDPHHPVHELIENYNIPVVSRYPNLSFDSAMQQLSDMHNREGYVIQFANGDMVKMKCPWYRQLHRSLSMLRERDIAELALIEQLDDLKSNIAEIGIDLTSINQVEKQLKDYITAIYDDIETIYSENKYLSQKDFAIKFKKHKYFSLLMKKFTAKSPDVNSWYLKNRLKTDFTLRHLINDTIKEALDS